MKLAAGDAKNATAPATSSLLPARAIGIPATWALKASGAVNTAWKFEAHAALVEYLAAKKAEVWTAPFGKVATRIKDSRK